MWARYIEALRGLADARRLAAVALVAASLLGTELGATHSLVHAALDAGLLAAFVLVAPGAYRALAPLGAVGHALYALLGVACVGAAVAVVRVFAPDGTYVVDDHALVVLVVLFLVGGFGLGRDVDLSARVDALALAGARAEVEAERRALEVEQAELAAEQARLTAQQNALLAQRAQLDPHFLFNVLNAIAEYCQQEPAVAERATLALAGVLRTMLDATRAPTWPLEKELELVREITELYAMRDRARFRFRLQWPRVDDLSIPPLLLLPIVENAVTHGPSAEHEGEVSIEVERAADGVEIRVENPGAFRGRREGGEGLAMIERRLGLAFGETAHFTIEARDARTVATVRMPLDGPRRTA